MEWGGTFIKGWPGHEPGHGGIGNMHFNMNRTWSQAVALVRANFQLLAIIAGVFLLLPALVFALVMPAQVDWVALGENPEAMSRAMAGMLGPLIGYGLVSIVLQFIGYGAMVALLGGNRPTVGEAIMLSLRCLPTMIGATLLFVLAYIAVAALLSLGVGLIAGALGAVGSTAGAAVLTVVVMLVLLIAVLYVMTRLSLALPIVVLEGVRNPVTVLRRSWQLTGPYAWSIFGFYALLFIAYLVISLLLFGLVGVIAAGLGQGPGAALFGGLINGLLGAMLAMVMSGILVSMNQQLAGRASVPVSTTFE